ncbi:sister chromatid cohesion protein PDS5 homolog B-like [Salmo trutta]|uniref:sister chromatid cohesion protein PDS5 homolog B-like n=1 Tax=Salmo trutta TaxID=8032 RepID=UPI001130B040|nr:sister chromatid cohesion protein PDS5 homolog B-like [Salmo trutta]
MMGLAQIYKKYSLQAEGGEGVSKQISWIKDKLLHIYYQNSIDDRLLVERIFAQYMLPHNLDTMERMKCLYYLYATLDDNAVKKPDMSRLCLAARCAVLKLAQEPCYHDIITFEQYQLCALVINDECYQVRQAFSHKLHWGLCRLRLPLEYLAVFTLCAKDPMKERRAHARQCLVKNINLRREYLKQHSAISEIKSFFTPGKPKAANVLGAVNKPLASAGKQTKLSRMETVSNTSSNSNPGSAGRSKGRIDSAEVDHSENEDITVMKSLAAQDDDSKPGRGCKRGAATASQDDKAGQEAKPKRGRRKEPAANTSMGVGEEPWAETNAADTTLETKDEQNNPPKRGRRRRAPQGCCA